MSASIPTITPTATPSTLNRILSDTAEAAESSTSTTDAAELQALWESYERERAQRDLLADLGEDVHPDPGFVVKLRSAGELPSAETGGKVVPVDEAASSSSSYKVFVNVCGSDVVPEPEVMDEERLRLPASCGPPRMDVDKRGAACLCVDVVLSTTTVVAAKRDVSYRDLIAEHVAATLEHKHGFAFLPERAFPKLKYKGPMPPPKHRIWKKGKREAVKAAAEEAVNGPEIKVPSAATGGSERSNAKASLIQEVAPEGATSGKKKRQRVVHQDVAQNSTGSATVPSKPEGSVEPDYTIGCVAADGTRTTLEAYSANAGAPAAMVVLIDLLAADGPDTMKLVATNNSLTLLAPPYYLHISLPYRVSRSGAPLAKFSSAKERLFVLLDVASQDEQAGVFTSSTTLHSNGVAPIDVHMRRLHLSNDLIFELI